MKILVTVGTTGFDELFRACDALDWNGHEVLFQIGPSRYSPTLERAVRYTGNIKEAYGWADVVITHAGAGSVFTLLEMGRRIVVVPNLTRRDKHQSELARFVEANRFAIVAWSPDELGDALRRLDGFDFQPYRKREFFLGGELSARMKAALRGERA